MPSFDKIKSYKKKAPSFFAPFNNVSEPVKVLAISVAAPIGGAVITGIGAMGTGINGAAAVTGVATCGVTSQCLGKKTSLLAKDTAGYLLLMGLGIVIMGVVPPLGLISLLTRTGATVVAAVKKSSSAPEVVVVPPQAAPESTGATVIPQQTARENTTIITTDTSDKCEEAQAPADIARLSPRR